MSKKAWRWFDRAVFFGLVSVAGMIVFSVAREFLMEKGYLIPDEQKRHLTDGAAYVRKKFDNAKITPPTQDTINRINRSNLPVDRTGTPVQAPKRRSFSERVGDPLRRGGKPSPLGNPLRSQNSFSQPRTPSVSVNSDEQITSPVVRSKDVITPSQKERVAPVVSTPKSFTLPSFKKTSPSLPAICENGFALDLKTQTGELRRFYFDMTAASQSASMKVSVSEYSGSVSEIGGNIKLNLVYYNPSQLAKGGKAFSVILNHKKDFLVAPYDPSLTQTVCVAGGDRVSLSYNQGTKNVSISSEQLSVPKDVKKVKESVRYVSAKTVTVPQRAIQLRKNKQISVVRANLVHVR